MKGRPSAFVFNSLTILAELLGKFTVLKLLLKGPESKKYNIVFNETFHRQKFNGTILFPESRHKDIDVTERCPIDMRDFYRWAGFLSMSVSMTTLGEKWYQWIPVFERLLWVLLHYPWSVFVIHILLYSATGGSRISGHCVSFPEIINHHKRVLE